MKQTPPKAFSPTPTWKVAAAIGAVAFLFAVWKYESVPYRSPVNTFPEFRDSRGIDWTKPVNMLAGTKVCVSLQELYRSLQQDGADCFTVAAESKVSVLFNGPAGLDHLTILDGTYAGRQVWAFQAQLTD
jgi:hypothetical protein